MSTQTTPSVSMKKGLKKSRSHRQPRRKKSTKQADPIPYFRDLAINPPNAKVVPKKNYKSKTQFKSLMKEPTSLAAQALGYGADSTKNTKELVYEYTDFFDWDVTGTDPKKPVKVVSYSPFQDVFGNDTDISDGGHTLARLISVCAWVLPMASNAATESTAFIALAGVCGVPTGYATQEPVLTGVQNTIVQPDFNVKWRKILSYKADKLFGDNFLAPLAHSDGSSIEAFRMSCVNPDSGAPLDGHKIQVMYTIRLAMTLPINSSRKVGVENVIGWKSKPVNSLSSDFILPEIRGLRDTS